MVDDVPVRPCEVTCATPQCENEGVTITVYAPTSGALFMCGPCGNALDAAPVGAEPIE